MTLLVLKLSGTQANRFADRTNFAPIHSSFEVKIKTAWRSFQVNDCLLLLDNPGTGILLAKPGR
jgi:hypothetical protein